MVKWKLDKNWFNLVVHVLGLNEVIIATKSGLGYVFLKTLDQRWILFREIRVGVNRLGNSLDDHETAWVGSQSQCDFQRFKADILIYLVWLTWQRYCDTDTSSVSPCTILSYNFSSRTDCVRQGFV